MVKLTNEKIIKAINGIKDELVKKVLFADGTSLCSIKFMHEHEEAFRSVLPTYYDEYMSYYGGFYDSHYYADRDRFMAYMCLETGVVDKNDFRTVKEFRAAGIEYVSTLGRDEPFSSLLFKDGVKNKEGEDKKLLAFLDENHEYLTYFLPLMCSFENDEFSAALSNYVKNAKLEDTLRLYVLEAMLRASDANVLLHFLDEIDKNNYYRFKALTEASVFVGDYTAVLPPKELTSVLRDAALCNCDKYSDADFRHAYHFINTYDRVHEDKFEAFALELLARGGDRARRALLRSLSAESINKNYTRAIFNAKPDLEDLSFFIHRLDCEHMDKSVLPLVFEHLFKVLSGMDKVSYHYKTDDDITFARDVSKAGIMSKLGEIAVRADNPEYIKRLDGIYDTLKEEAQAKYLRAADKKTKLDTRLCAVKFLKTDNYTALKYYDDKNIKLTYGEAVIVSDFLKTKKENIKNMIIKEYLLSTDADKICDYLLSCKEDYKKAAGEEMQKSRGKVDNEKLEGKVHKGYYAVQGESIFTLEKPESEIEELAAKKTDIEPLKPLPHKKVKEIFGALKDFIKEHADYEYATNYSEGLVTFGAEFTRLKGSELGANGFDAYPLGQELKGLMQSFSEEELAGMLVLLHCVGKKNKELYKAVCGKLFSGADESYKYAKSLDKGYFVMNEYKVLDSLENAIGKELLSEKTRLAMLAAFTRRSALGCYIDDDGDPDGYPGVYCHLLTDSEDIETLKALCTFECIFIQANATSTIAIELTAKAFEYGIISENLARYFILVNGHLGGTLSPSSPEYIMRSDYKYKKFKAFLLNLIDEALEVEFKRGSLQTPYSHLLGWAERFFGVEKYFRAIVSLRSLTWVRSPWSFEKNEILSCILKKAVRSDDTYESFVACIEKYKITDEELIRATLFNPEFVDFTAKYLNIPHLKLAVFWFIAHLNESLDGDKQERRIEQIKEFSAISYPDFKDGAFDCDWYNEMIEKVPESVLSRIYANAKYVTVGGLHKRAQRFFDAMNGRIQKDECLEKMNTTRNKDYCLIYSLIPVKDRADLYGRYTVLAEFARTSKQFGAQRQLSERRTVDIALENLARAAGYASADIFMFEMESENPSDIYKPYSVEDICVTPYIDEQKFKISYTVTRGEKVLPSIPTKYGKSETIKNLREEIKTLNKKFRRIIQSFENSMCTRTPFTAEELCGMCREPIIASVLSKLVLIADGKLCVYNGGLKDLDGKPVASKTAYIAHPVELKQKDLLSAALGYIAKNNIRQPFKQVLRGIYTKTEIELTQDEVLRFKGFEVDLKKCIAALKGKGWGVSEDIGLRKVYYRTDTVAAIFRECDFLYTADFENVNRELHGVFFLKRKSGEIIPLKEVDDITFSETLRDVDLMISISSKVIYDFSLAMSTIEVRHEVLKSIVGILGLGNVSFLKDNIKVAGTYGTYTVNIRTGLVFKEGKGNLALDTVYSVDKPILLDFVDEDPMTADIISKAIVLANDAAVKDPAILREIKD